ncbi:WD40 repeat domain-containing protein [Armatimonas rosea]|uniref:WD40 repeat protein n=1 Tax=Armatimonas rosea TaxID=685828 RepID=A0A7W9SP34_ARMRO|nr:WD40 repeat domain-containing protein [Armatimonas rosea]MBB6049424.1 WD40 repeat protein [Armatimonas rosea]
MSRFTRTHCLACHTPYVPRATACTSCGKPREPFSPRELLVEELPEGVRLLHCLQDSASTVLRIAFAPEGDTLASASADSKIRLWDTKTGELRQVLTGHTASVLSVAYSPDGQTLVSTSYDNTVQLWDARRGEHRQTLEAHTDDVYQAAFSPDGKTLASASKDQTIRLWDAETGEPQQRLTGHTEAVHTVLFSPDGQCLASGSEDKTIRLWDAKTGQGIQTLNEETNGPYYCLAFSPDGTTLASTSDCSFVRKGGSANVITLWNVATGEILQRLQHYYKPLQIPYLTSLAFSPDGQLLASLNPDVRLWHVETGAQLALIHEPFAYGWTSNLVFHPHLPLLATIGSLPAKGRRNPAYNGDEIHLYTLDIPVLLGKAL